MSPLLHDAVDRPRTYYNLQNAQKHTASHQSDSEQQVPSLADIPQEVTAVCLLKVSVFNIIWHCGLAVGPV